MWKTFPERLEASINWELYQNIVGTDFQLHLTAATDVHGAKSAGSLFNVYLRNAHQWRGQAVRRRHLKHDAATYTGAGDTLHQAFPTALFAEGEVRDIEVVAPNGFLRAYLGDTVAPHPLSVSMKYEMKGRTSTGDVEVKLQNNGASALLVELDANSYSTGNTMAQVIAHTEQIVVLDCSMH